MSMFVLPQRAITTMIFAIALMLVHTLAYLLPKNLTFAMRPDERFSVSWKVLSDFYRKRIGYPLN